MNHSETDIVTGCFVEAGAVAYESGKLYDGKVPGVGVLNHGSDDAATTECAAGGTFRENPGGVSDGISTDGTEAVATKESQLTPPMRSSATQNAKAPRTRAASARNAKAWSRFLRERIGF